MTQRPLSLGVATRRVLADEVTDDLRDAIVSHELEPGRKLTEDELAAQLGVSRGPVREALMRLEREGLVVIERHRGATIASWNRQDIEEIYSFQNFIEEFCNSLGCEIYFWSADDEIINKESNEFKSKRKYLFPEANIDMTQYLRRKYGAETIHEETSGEVLDQQHYGEKGHIVMGEIFYNEIIIYLRVYSVIKNIA